MGLGRGDLSGRRAAQTRSWQLGICRGCADRILDGYDDARVRTHILTLATKQARDCLRHERCELLEVSPE